MAKDPSISYPTVAPRSGETVAAISQAMAKPRYWPSSCCRCGGRRFFIRRTVAIDAGQLYIAGAMGPGEPGALRTRDEHIWLDCEECGTHNDPEPAVR